MSVRHRWSRYATVGSVGGMTSMPGSPTGTTGHSLPADHLSTPHAPLDRTFGMRFTSTPSGARLARRLAAHSLDAWGVPYDTSTHDAIDKVFVGQHSLFRNMDSNLRETIRTLLKSQGDSLESIGGQKLIDIFSDDEQ